MELLNSPLVSIVTPSYNQAKFLDATIKSILVQDYQHIEYIIVDGCSTDGSVEIIQRYSDRLAFWVSEPDRGQVNALNKGFQHAKGDILGWLNSDDVYLSAQVISDVVSLFQKYPDVQLVSGSGTFIDENGKWIRQTRSSPEYASYKTMCYRSILLQPATFFSKQVLISLPLDESLHYVFDWDFFIRAVKHFNLLAVNDMWAGYRWWGQNKTASGSSKRICEQAEVIKRYIGKNSWQYRFLCAFYHSYHLAEGLPACTEKPAKHMIHTFSKIVSAITYNRIPIIS